MMGLSSGLDTDSIIQSTLRMHQFRIDNQMRTRRLIEWRQQTHNTIRDEITNLRQTFLSNLGSKSMMNRNVFNASVANVTGRNPSAVSVSTPTGSPTGTIQIHSITSLARGANVTSTNRVTDAAMNKKLSDIGIDVDNIVINGQNASDMKLSNDDTLEETLKKINSHAPAGVTMSFDALSQRFTLESNTIGTASTLTFSGLGDFGIVTSTINTTVQNGTFAVYDISINGKRETVTDGESNVITLGGGVRITLRDTIDEPLVIDIKRDTTKAMDAIKDFINSYNAIIKRLEDLLSERKTANEASYKPLTDEEKQGMTEKQIEEWEAIAKKGILRNDQGIQNLVFSLRSSFFEDIEGMGLGVTASSLGLSTGSFFDKTGGQIMIDEDRLRAALEENPDRVADIFIKIDSSGESPRGVGLLHKIDGLMRNFVNTSQSTSIRQLEDSLKRTNDQISKMQERMFAEEDRLYRQFAAMETAMSKLQQQGDWFGAMLGGR
jgi:flagellar hook-associated protein 2